MHESAGAPRLCPHLDAIPPSRAGSLICKPTSHHCPGPCRRPFPHSARPQGPGVLVISCAVNSPFPDVCPQLA